MRDAKEDLKNQMKTPKQTTDQPKFGGLVQSLNRRDEMQKKKKKIIPVLSKII